MGALYQGTCYASTSLAQDAYYAGALPALTSGTTSYLTEFINVSGVWKIQRYSIAGDGTATTLNQSNAPAMSFPECNPAEQFNDGMALGWGIALALVLSWGITQMKRGL